MEEVFVSRWENGRWVLLASADSDSVSNHPDTSLTPVLAVNRAGELFVAWDNGGNDRDIFVRRYRE